jgi:isocitrate dehydrogenase kinase/phosphatase
MVRRARTSFEAGDWAGLRRASEERLLLYPRRVTDVVVELARLSLWHPIPVDRVRNRFLTAIESRPDREVAETFFNSAIRRLLGTQGVDHGSEFLDLAPPVLAEDGVATRLAAADGAELPALIDGALTVLGPRVTWEDRGRDGARIVERLRQNVPDVERGAELAILPEPLIRNRRAFLVARLTTDRRAVPFVVALAAGPRGLAVDALLTTEDEASMVFSFTRSYFQVEVEHPRKWVAFLNSLLPSKRLDELYTAIGYYKHGKREFYQQLQRLLREPDVRFEPAEGARGLVMLVFTLKPMNSVFKVIKDRPDPPKTVSRREVLAKYQFVFLQEHGGRLADSQEFEGLAMPKRAFEPPVLDELTRLARDTVTERGENLVFSHLYTERRMTPLDVYLRQVGPDQARAAVLDFGQAIKDLALLNIFPGDMLTKNFGITRHGRAVFYDYDEICPVTACAFRNFPRPRSEEDELAAEPWYPVHDGDMFPEEWERFLRFPEPLHREFLHHHGDLFTTGYWNDVIGRLSSGEISEPAPYSAIRRFGASA